MADIVAQLQELQQKEQEIEDQTKKLEEVKTQTADYENKKSGLEKELTRIRIAIDAAREDKRISESKDKSFVERLREENLAKAKQRIIDEFGYSNTPEALKTLDEKFKQIDSNAVTEDKIYDDLFAAHVLTNPKKYKEMEEEQRRLKREAENMTAQQSSSAGIGGGNPPSVESVELTKEDIDAARWAGIPLEKYRELKAKGKIE